MTTNPNTDQPTRPIYTIAREVQADWKNVWYGAVPYLRAMHQLNSINDNYYEDPAREVIRYFLSNASNWRGPVARQIKAELKGML